MQATNGRSPESGRRARVLTLLASARRRAGRPAGMPDPSTSPTRGEASLLPWFVAGVLLLALFLVTVFHYRESVNPAQLIAAKAARVDLVRRMEVSLASASEAEKSAVLATSDQDSRRFADVARAAASEVEEERAKLGALLASGTAEEQALLAQFSGAFADLRRVDDQVLGLAVQNTNLKAYALAFGPAGDAAATLDTALARVAGRQLAASDATRGATPDATRIQVLASDARLGVLRIQAALAPHIAEESDARMDQMEAAMTQEAQRVRSALDSLAALPVLRKDVELTAASAQFTRYQELERQILKLSRENTNVRSLELSLHQKRNALTLCLEELHALEQAISKEPIPGITGGPVPLPR